MTHGTAPRRYNESKQKKKGPDNGRRKCQVNSNGHPGQFISISCRMNKQLVPLPPISGRMNRNADINVGPDNCTQPVDASMEETKNSI